MDAQGRRGLILKSHLDGLLDALLGHADDRGSGGTDGSSADLGHVGAKASEGNVLVDLVELSLGLLIGEELEGSGRHGAGHLGDEALQHV